MDSKPTSWPRSRIESHITKTSREKRKLQSSSPSSRNHPASVRHMKRFQKSTAIYTLPIRGKQHTGTHCKTGKYAHLNYFFSFDFWYRSLENSKLEMGHFFFHSSVAILIKMYWCYHCKDAALVSSHLQVCLMIFTTLWKHGFSCRRFFSFSLQMTDNIFIWHFTCFHAVTKNCLHFRRCCLYIFHFFIEIKFALFSSEL